MASGSDRGPVSRPSFPQLAPGCHDGLTMSKAFTVDRTLGGSAIGSALSGFPET